MAGAQAEPRGLSQIPGQLEIHSKFQASLNYRVKETVPQRTKAKMPHADVRLCYYSFFFNYCSENETCGCAELLLYNKFKVNLFKQAIQTLKIL